MPALGAGARDLAGLLSLWAEGVVAWHFVEGLWDNDPWEDCRLLGADNPETRATAANLQAVSCAEE